MLGRLFSYVTLIVSAYFFFRYRYKVLNVLLSQRWIRRMIVTSTMRWPGVRSRFMSQMFQTQSPVNER